MIHWSWMFVPAWAVFIIMIAFSLSGRDSQEEREQERCAACHNAMQREMREHGDQRYRQGRADQGGPPVDAVIAMPRGYHDVTGFYDEEVGE